MTREEAKNLARSRDCHCVSGKDRDNNYNKCIDKIFDFFESKIEEFGREAFYLGREIGKFDDRGYPLFKRRTYNEYLREIENKK